MQSQTGSSPETPLVTDHVADADSVLERIVLAVATVENTEIDDVPPLTSVVDPDALSDLFAHGETVGHVSFRYHGHRVVVTASGELSVY